jgi:purine nucleosidase
MMTTMFFRIILIVFVFGWSFVCCQNEASGPRKVILDLDPAALVDGGFDVDDDLALLIALGSRREIDLIGITVTYGNAPLEQTLANARLLAKIANISSVDVPIAAGVSWMSRTLARSNASQLIESLVLQYPHQVHVIAVGPTTNVAAALHNNAQLEKQIASITVMGGDLSDGSIGSLHIDLNFMAHREATNVVLAADTPKLIVTVQTCISVSFQIL